MNSLMEASEWSDGEMDFYEEYPICNDCNGSGSDYCIPYNPCPSCGGRGWTRDLYFKRKDEEWRDQYPDFF